MYNIDLQADAKNSSPAQQQADVQRTLTEAALAYHRPRNSDDIGGKIQVSITKPVTSMDDLALAYSPGVAAPCLEIERDPALALPRTLPRATWWP